jgi:hypothetical protein
MPTGPTHEEFREKQREESESWRLPATKSKLSESLHLGYQLTKI